MKRLFSLIVALLVFFFTLTSCAETPSQSSVIGKNDSGLEEAIDSLPSEPVDLDQIIEEEKRTLDQYSFISDDGVVHFRFSGEVKYPETDKFPVILAAPRLRTSGEVERICRVLCGDSPIYEYSEQLSKAELEEAILDLERHLDPDAMYEYYQGDSDLIEIAKQFQEQRLENLKRLYEEASENVEKKLSTFEFMPDSYWYTTSGMTGGDGDSIRAVSDVDGVPMYMAEFQHNGSDYRIDNFHAFPNTHVKQEEEFYQTTPITEEDAQRYIETAEQIIREMDIGTWKCGSYRFMNKEIHGITYYWIVTTWSPYYEGIPVTMQPQIMDLTSDDIYGAKYRYETMMLFLTSNRIISMEYISPMGTQKVLNENVEILPYDKIMERIISQLKVTYTTQSVSQMLEWALFGSTGVQKTLEEATVLINGIELGYARINVPDSETDFYFVPAWTVTGTVIPGNESTLTEEWIKESSTTLLCINAIDGSVIDVSKGY